MSGRTPVGRVVVAALVAFVIPGCADQPGTTARQGSGSPSELSRSAVFDRAVLAGVPDDCRLLEIVGAPDDPSHEDAALGDLIATGLDAELARGPLVGIDVRGPTGTTVVAADLFGGETAVWVTDPDARRATTAANEAAAVSTFPFEPVDSAGEDALAFAMASAIDCSVGAANPFRPIQSEPAPSMRPDLLMVVPGSASPGDTVAMRFPEETGRGVAFQLDERVGGEWVTRYWLTSDGNGGRPVSVPMGTGGYGVPDVGVGGPGPDHVVLPADVTPGSYRICTANAGDDFCSPIEVLGEP